MDGTPPHAPTRPSWTVFVGPGPRLALLPPLLGALRPDPSWEVRRLEDVDELFGPLVPRGRAVLDSDELDQDDVGFVRRFVERNPDWELVLTGADSTARTGRKLLAHPRVRWMDWPLDVDQLRGLWEPVPAGAARPATQPRSHGAPPAARTESAPPSVRLENDELQEIRSILEGAPEARDEGASPPPGPRLAAHAPDPSEVDELEPTDLGPASLGAAELDDEDLEDPGAPAALPGFYRDQIADLADIAQRLQLSTSALQDAVQRVPELAQRRTEPGSPGGGDTGLHARLHGLELDVSRLLQFTRTLSFLAAPPENGDQQIDVGSLLEELLGSLAGSTPDSPRYLFRAAPGLLVRSDKLLLVQAFDALLQLATRCAGPDDVVRVAAHAQPQLARATGPRPADAEPSPGGSGEVEVRISFPAGPLGELEPERIQRPYALRRTLPAIGPNALAAAGGIVRGQGGALELEEIEPGRLTWIVRFPAPSSNGHPA